MNSEEKIKKKLLKKDMNKIGVTLVGYEVLLNIIFLEYFCTMAFIQMLKNPSNMAKFDFDKFYNIFWESGQDGMIYLFGIGISVLFMFLLRKKELFTCDLKVSRKKMQWKYFGIFLACFMAPQLLFIGLGNVVESSLNYFGYTIMNAMESASAGSNSIAMFLYASLLGPISEEIIFRGAILRILEKQGRVFAIIVSAVLFGLFHGNILQGIFATCVGIVLGYVAMEYSIKWAMLLHIINNFVFGDLLLFLTKGMSETQQNIIYYIIIGAFTIVAVISVFVYRAKIKEYINRYRIADKKKYLYAFTSVWTVIFILGSLVLGLMGIEKL